MRIARILMFIGFWLFIGSFGIARAAEGVEAVDSAWLKAFNANDIDAILACYAPDAIGWFPDMPQAKGTAEIRAAYQKFLADNTISNATTSDTHYQTVGERSVGWGRFSMTVTPKAGGAPVTMTGRFTEIAEKHDGRWVYLVDHASADPPPTTQKQTNP